MKKALAWVLTLAMLLTMASFPVFAAEVPAIPVAKVTSNQAANGTNTVNNLADGKTSGTYYQTAASIDAAAPDLVITFDFGMKYKLTRMDAVNGSNYITSATLYVSNDGVNFENSESQELDGLKGSGNYSNTGADLSFEGSYRYAKLVAKSLNQSGQVAIREITFTGTTEFEKLVLTAANAKTYAPTYGPALSATKGTKDYAILFDGDNVYGATNFLEFDKYNEKAELIDKNKRTLELDLGACYDIGAVNLYGGSTTWGYCAPLEYYVYVAGEDGVFGDAIYHYGPDTSKANPYKRKDIIPFGNAGKSVQKIKFDFVNYRCRLALNEVEVYAAEPAAAVPVNYTIKQVDTNGDPIAEDVVLSGNVGDTIEVPAPEVADYILQDDATKSITLNENAAYNIVTFTYAHSSEVEMVNYTIKQLSIVDGSPVADDVVLSGVVGATIDVAAPAVSGYSVDGDATKQITLSANAEENVVTFIYGVPTTYKIYAVLDGYSNFYLYTKEYSDYVGRNIVVNAPSLNGFTCIGDNTQNVTLVTNDTNKTKNIITFKYSDGISSVDGSEYIPVYSADIGDVTPNGSNAITKVYDDSITTYFQSSATFTGDGTSPIATVTLDLGHSVKLTELCFALGDSYIKSGKLYVSDSADGGWTPIYDFSADASTVSALYSPDINSGTNEGWGAGKLAHRTIDTEVYGRYVKFEIYYLSASAKQIVLRELSFKGIYKEDKIALTGDSVINIYPCTTADGYVNGTDVSILFDGNPKWALENVVAGQGYYNSATTFDNPFEIEIDLGGYYDVSELVLFTASPNWATKSPILQYDVYVSRDNVYPSTAAYTSPDYETETNPKNRRDNVDLSSVTEPVRYIKISINKGIYRVAFTEIQVFGTATAKPDGRVNALGGQIRVANNEAGIPAGLRFGASFAKDLYGIAGDYTSAGSAVQFGMILLPKSMLGGYATIDALVAADGTNADQVLDVPATRIFKQDAYTVGYTAVLKSIPDTEFNTEICAVPYAQVGGVRTYFAQMEKSYSGVAKSAHDSYSAGNPNGLTQADIEAIEAILTTAGVDFTPIDFPPAE